MLSAPSICHDSGVLKDEEDTYQNETGWRAVTVRLRIRTINKPQLWNQLNGVCSVPITN